MAAQPRARDTILSTALSLFAEKGFAQTSTDDIVKAANVSKGLVFYHFKSKEGLLHMIFMQALSHLEVILPLEEETIPSEKALYHMIDFMLASLTSNQDFWRLHLAISQDAQLWKTVVPAEIHEFWKKYRQFLVNSFKSMAENDVERRTEVFETFRVGLFFQYLHLGQVYPVNHMRKSWKALVTFK